MTFTRARRLLCTAAAVGMLALVWAGAGVAQPAISQPAAPLAVTVTGGPAPIETLRLAIETAVRTALPEAREAQVQIVTVTPVLAPLPPGASASVQAVVELSSTSGPTFRRAFAITLTNAIVPWPDAQVLLVSNSPETLSFSKVLYNGTLMSGQTARLLYHHENGSKTERMNVEVTFSNPTTAPIILWVTGAYAGPAAANELVIGHAAAMRFLDQETLHAGFLMSIPPNTTMPVFVQDVPPLGLVSGLAQVALVTGDRLNLQVVARLGGEAEPPTDSYAPNADVAHQRGAFGQPAVTRSLTYVAGGAPAVMTLAANPDLLRDVANVPLQGNYGVVYTFNVEVSNPTDATVVASLVMHADGGQARGTFIVDGQLIDGPPVQANSPQLVTAVRLAPGLTRTLQIITMPESGSNYPVRLLFGPAP